MSRTFTWTLIAVSGVDLIATLWWFSMRFTAPSDAVTINGVEWRLAATRALNQDEAVRVCPQGFRLPTEGELKTLVGSPEIRSRFPQLLQDHLAVWSSSKYLKDKWL